MKLTPNKTGRDLALGWIVVEHVHKTTPGGIRRFCHRPYQGLWRLLYIIMLALVAVMLGVTLLSRASDLIWTVPHVENSHAEPDAR